MLIWFIDFNSFAHFHPKNWILSQFHWFLIERFKNEIKSEEDMEDLKQDKEK
jgi:hypothetical protein